MEQPVDFSDTWKHGIPDDEEEYLAMRYEACINEDQEREE